MALRIGVILLFLLSCCFPYVGPLTMVVNPNRNLAFGRHIEATYTCGEVNGRPIREMYCSIAGASPYNPHDPYSYSMGTEESGRYRELKAEMHSFLQEGQNCDFCEAGTSHAHPASNMVDGSPSWWMSPPLSRGMQYSEVNITIDLEQEFYVAYIIIQMANSPRPGTWILEHSTDHGKTYQPWQYFASSPAECSRLFGIASLSPISEDDSVICTSEHSGIQPLENGEIMLNLLDQRPSKNHFSISEKLQNFVRATNVRIRLLKPKTLQGHLMDLQGKKAQPGEASVTRRYFYGIKEINMGGRCVCNGHADSCDVLDANRPRALLCRCEHNTCGDNCDRCCAEFVQKKWRTANENDPFECEPCNCHGHSLNCVYDEQLDAEHGSLDIHGKYEGGGRCIDCQDNTEGVNCNKCRAGFYRPRGHNWNETNVCHQCVCDPEKHSGTCAEETGKCDCLPKFTGEDCDQCAQGYYHPPECRPCECNVNGTVDGVCLPEDSGGQCPCKEGYGGTYCEECAPGYTNITAGCVPCQCDTTGAQDNECDAKTGKCSCKSNFGGLHCERCSNGYFNHPACDYCDCDSAGTEDDICDQTSGQCLCKEGFAGRRCEHCDDNYYGYPNCRECECNSVGSKTAACDPVTGECPCLPNFTSRTCDRCAAKYYRFPECLECGCNSAGSKGVTCDNDGQCYCKPTFEGLHCDRCKPKTYNFPICEECNCHPSGVIPEFAGCDKVAPGELCTCRKNVQGRTCSQCKPTYWDLQAHHEDGCIDCNCNKTGTLSLLNACDPMSGQCSCKRHVAGQKCDYCAEGFYNMRANNHFGCETCECDVGGAVGRGCNPETGQCRCRPRVEGLRCDKPIQDHYFPTLWHHQYEAEEGRHPGEDGKPVRYAIDAAEFPDYSWRGFVVFSPIQDEIVLDVDVKKSAVYRLLFHYKNPTDVNVDIVARFVPSSATQTDDGEQSVKALLKPTSSPVSGFINNKEKPFVLGPGRWHLHIKSPKRLFLDYVVLIPSEYYEGAGLNELTRNPCQTNDPENTACVELLYPPLPVTLRVDAGADPSLFTEVDSAGNEGRLSHVPEAQLPSSVGHAALVKTDPERGKEIRVNVDVPEDGLYHVLVEYHNMEEISMPVRVRLEQDSPEEGQESSSMGTSADALLLINHCPYIYFCRELITVNGKAALLGLGKSPPPLRVTLIVQPGREFALASINLIKEENWHTDYLKQVATCVRRGGSCVGEPYAQPPNSILVEAENGMSNMNSSIRGDRLPFSVSQPEELRVMSIDNAQSTLDVEGIVATPGDYVFVVHYYNPDNGPILSHVLVQNERFADALHSYCPSMSGCRTFVVDKENGDKFFNIADKYTLTFYHNVTQKGPIYIDSVIAVPRSAFSHDAALKPMALDVAQDFVERCSDEEGHFANRPHNISDYCRRQIFSLTSTFNGAALPCECNPQGSLDFTCAKYGGQCRCKPNVIGRTCDRCAPGYYNYPDCLKCKCGRNQQCDDVSGQCFCPRYVEGQQCDRCVPYAFGYDPLIGCQLCGCVKEGSHDGELECDPMNGQCLCKENVGGRRCEKCLPGYYGFPNCYECDCEDKGTTDSICDAQSAKCLCKKNVVGQGCDSCRPGTFDLRKSDIEGCSECFCFGTTDRCRSANFSVHSQGFEESIWRVTDPTGVVTLSKPGERTGRRITYMAGRAQNGEGEGAAASSGKVNFIVPINPGGDYTTSYGLHFAYTVSGTPRASKTPSVNTGPDIQLVSGESTLEYWAAEQPSNLSSPFKIVVSLFPDFWINTHTGEPSTRAQLMQTLLKLDKVLVKASYYESPQEAVLEDFMLEMSTPTNTPNRDERYPKASSVEMCECPPPYMGPSCQLCAPGYYRVGSSGSFLGSCVPCNCNGHSGSCYPETDLQDGVVAGVCYDCQHNTEGERCERCVEGFYGNASTGTPMSCMRCACPYPTASNNFAHSCSVDAESGMLERCVCKRGYTGDRCEMCEIGFYGEPLRTDSMCLPCFCNDNNNLNEEGACNRQTGDCALCEMNTDGRRCEYCKEWYWGDAIEKKNCTECPCDKCGSRECNNTNGNCECQPMVEGANCDRCAENTWGFDSCRGCRPCGCGLASANAQCNLKTGQCACMHGAAGLYCERCEHGYWDYGPQGCKKCDCEADLSMGTVCDVNTGQCHCQEGAIGARCDRCIDTYLRVPELGCRFCDQCVHALDAELIEFEKRVENVSSSLGNISSVALTGARLKRIQKAMAAVGPVLDTAIPPNDWRSTVAPELSPKAQSIKETVGQLSIRGDRALEQVARIERNVTNAFDTLMQLRQDANDMRSTAEWVIEKAKLLRQTFEYQASPPPNREQLVSEAERLLASINENFNNSQVVIDLQEELANSGQTLERISEFKTKRNQLMETIAERKRALRTLTNASVDFGTLMNEAKKTAQAANETLRLLSLFTLTASIGGVEKESAAMAVALKEQEALLDNVTKAFHQLNTLNEAAETRLTELNETRQQLSENEAAGVRRARRVRRDLANQREKARQRAQELEDESRRMAGIFDAARLESSQAMNAVNAYREVVDTVRDAKQHSSGSTSNTQSAKSMAKGQGEKARLSAQKSEQLRSRVGDLEAKDVRELRAQHQLAEHKAAGLGAKVGRLQHDFRNLNISSIGQNSRELLTSLDSTAYKAEQAESTLRRVNDSFTKLKPDMEKEIDKVNGLVEGQVAAEEARNTARNQIDQTKASLPELEQEWTAAAARLGNTSALVSECKSKLAALSERVQMARDKANRIKLGAHFEKGSMLELPISQESEDFGFFTSARFFFRTREPNGLLFFLGGDNAKVAGNFMALELVEGRPKLSVNFGTHDTTSTTLLDEQGNVADNQWREAVVERVGKRTNVRVMKPRSVNQPEDEQTLVTSDARSVFKLFDDERHLFVGGFPAGYRAPSAVSQQSYVGDLDNFRLNGELIGFWNSERAKQITGAEMRPQLDEEHGVDAGVSFNGKPGTFMQIDVGGWNPRKQTAIILTFLTHSPDGLLFHVGKDRDQMTVELVNGHVQLSYDLGSGMAKLLSNKGHYSDGRWHGVHINRVERQAKLEVDSTDTVEGESPGSMFEMSVSNSFFLGGLPRDSAAPSTAPMRFTTPPFRGCIRNVKLDVDNYVDLNINKAKASKGVQASCLNREMRVVSLLSERSFLHIRNQSVDRKLELAFRFRTAQTTQNAHILSVGIAADPEAPVAEALQNEILRIELIDSQLSITPGNTDEAETGMKMELSTHLAGNWHYVAVQRTKSSLKVHVDDVYSKEVEASYEGPGGELISSKGVILAFGRNPESSQHFVGCVGDVVLNGHLVDLVKDAESNELRMTGCSISGAVFGQPPAAGSEEKGVVLATDSPAGRPATPAPPGETSTIAYRPSVSNVVRPEGACALPEVSHGEREDSSGIRFGLSPSSRLEFDRPPDPFDRNLVFSIQLRATAANGIIMFVTNEKHSDFMALYLDNGRIVFSYGNGAARLTIRGERSLLDDEWHTVRVAREGSAAALDIDGHQEAEDRSEGADLMDAQPPLYIGGLPSDLVPYVSKILPSIKPEFGGCLRDFKLNDKKFDDTGREIGTVPCSQYEEEGIYFAKDGGYAIIDPNFVLGQSLSIELEVKPRTKDAVLLSVGVLEFLTLQLINGTVKFSVDNGAGVESVIFDPPTRNHICDGHWHHIKLYKKKNLITLNVDGKSNLKIMKKKAAIESTARDPLYLGGVPKGVKQRGLDTIESFIGCIRVVNIGTRNRRETDLSSMTLFGSVERNACPIN